MQLSGRQHKVLDEQASRYQIPILGATIDLSWTVHNRGVYAASANWYDEVLISDDKTR